VGRVVEPHPGESGSSSLVFHLAQQPRFADPRLAAQEHRSTAARLGSPAQQAGEARLLVVATNQRGHAPERMADDAALAPEAQDCDHSTLPSQQAFAEMLHADVRSGGRGRRVVHQDLVRFGHLLQPRGGRHGIPRQSQGARPRHLPRSGHNLAGGDADPKLERPVVPDLASCQCGLHFQGAQARPKGIVVVAQRCPKHRQNGIPRELLDRAAEADDSLAEEAEGLVHTRPDLLQVQLGDEAGVSDQVGEQGAHDAPVTGRQPIGERLQPPAAQVAEMRTRRGRRTAIWTGHRNLVETRQYYPATRPFRARESQPI
jgi:hypothetical protein